MRTEFLFQYSVAPPRLLLNLKNRICFAFIFQFSMPIDKFFSLSKFIVTHTNNECFSKLAHFSSTQMPMLINSTSKIEKFIKKQSIFLKILRYPFSCTSSTLELNWKSYSRISILNSFLFKLIKAIRYLILVRVKQ